MRLFAVLLALMPVSLFAGELQIQGTGVVKVRPDTAYVTVGVTTQNESAVVALKEKTDKMEALFNVLESNGITKDEFSTTQFDVAPVYVYKKDEPPTLVGYTVANTVNVMICDLGKVGKLLDAFVSDGANQVQSLAFGVKDTEKHLDRARSLAMHDAMRKAKIYCNAAQLKVVDIQSVRESGRNTPVRSQYFSAKSAVSGDVPVNQGTQDLSITVDVQLKTELDPEFILHGENE